MLLAQYNMRPYSCQMFQIKIMVLNMEILFPALYSFHLTVAHCQFFSSLRHYLERKRFLHFVEFEKDIKCLFRIEEFSSRQISNLDF